MITDGSPFKSKLRVLLVGYGSIGARHHAVLSELGCDTAICSRQLLPDVLCFKTIEEATSTYEPNKILVSNATADHREVLRYLDFKKSEADVLVEKPLFSFPDDDFSVGFQKHVNVAYNLRFHPVILALREALKEEQAVAAQFYVGMYLPAWRPSRDYRMTYSSSVAQGGGVLRDLSHELDLALWLFGSWTSLVAHGGHFSELEIETEDTVGIMWRAENCPKVNLELNYLDRVPRRSILVHTTSHSWEVDLIQGNLLCDGVVKQAWNVERNSTYLAQDSAWLNGERTVLCSFLEGLEVLRLIEAIESSITNQSWIQKPSIL